MPRAQTVLGDVDTADLGVTSCHEHLLIDITKEAFEPPPEDERRFVDQPLTLENRWWVRQNWASNLDNLVSDSVDEAVREIRDFGAAGGGCVVDATSAGLSRDRAALRTISEAAGVHVIAGAGFYTAKSQDAATLSLTAAELTRRIVADLTPGGDQPAAGFIGEVGCTWPLEDFERRSLEASVAAQQETGALISVHPGRDSKAPVEIAELYVSLGGDPARLVMCHLDRTVMYDEAAKRALLAVGCFLEYDLFGFEVSLYPKNPLHPMPSDAQRVADLVAIKAAGALDRVLLAHDICFKFRRKSYGGHGYDHLLRSARRQMLLLGLDQADVDLMFVANPARAFTLP